MGGLQIKDLYEVVTPPHIEFSELNSLTLASELIYYDAVTIHNLTIKKVEVMDIIMLVRNNLQINELNAKMVIEVFVGAISHDMYPYDSTDVLCNVKYYSKQTVVNPLISPLKDDMIFIIFDLVRNKLSDFIFDDVLVGWWNTKMLFGSGYKLK